MSHLQSINLPLIAAAFATANTLNATPTGSTNLLVCRFDNTAVTDREFGTAAQIVITTTAANGTEFSVNQPGVFYFGAQFAHAAGATNILVGLSQDAAPANLTNTDWTVTTAQFIDSFDGINVAALQPQYKLGGVVFVTRTAAFAAGGSVLRVQASNSAGAAPAALVAALCRAQIARIAKLYE